MVDAFALATFRGQYRGTPAQWEDIVSTLRRCVGGDLIATLKDFGKATRAAAQMLVGWDENYTMLFDFLSAIQDPDDMGDPRDLFREKGRGREQGRQGGRGSRAPKAPAQQAVKPKSPNR
ncbi:MAG: hypothetical protein AB7H77_12060 [Bdellovibrionales bacterium]